MVKRNFQNNTLSSRSYKSILTYDNPFNNLADSFFISSKLFGLGVPLLYDHDLEGKVND